MIPEYQPNFFIIGAAKSGTTAFYDVLNQHPQVYLPYQKEPNFFSNETNYSKGLGWYCKTYFQDAGKYPCRGEASPQYLNWGEKVSERLLLLNKSHEIKIIVIFRDPVARAYSHYWMLVNRELEKLSFEEALKAEEERLSLHHTELEDNGSLRYGYFRGGMYASLLQPYLRRFPRKNFHFILQDDMKNDFSGMMNNVCIFLGIDPGHPFQPMVSNTAYMARNHKLHHFLHHPSGPVFKAMRNVIKKLPHEFQYRLRRKIVALNMKPAKNPPLDPGLEADLRKRYLDEIGQLESIIGRNLDHWKVNNG